MTSAASRTAIKAAIAAAGVAVGACLVWGLRSLIVPVVVGALLAYICRPLVLRFERRRIPRIVAVASLLLMVVLAGLLILGSVRAVMPSEAAALDLRVHAMYRVNDRYRAVMGLDESLTGGNRLYRMLHRDLDPLVDQANELLALTADERIRFLAARAADAAGSDQLVGEDRANVATLELRLRSRAPAEPPERTVANPPRAPEPTAAGPVPTLGTIFSSWFIAPLVFLFLLLDTGEIKRGLLSTLPNRLFEPALAVLADLDRALGAYFRGIFVECCVLGLTVAVFMAIVGIPPKWAIAIGIVSGASNVVPYMGFAAALLSGLAYALLAEDVRSVIPLVTTETFPLWVLGAVMLAELLKNIVYEPFVLGGAVQLHPLVVVIGVVGGATLFGPVGMLLAIPTITVAKVFVTSTAGHLRAYGVL